MKIALLTAGTRVAPVFANVTTYLLINNKKPLSANIETYQFHTQNEFEMANELLIQVELVICGAIPYYLEKFLISQGCAVLSFIAGEAEDVFDAYQQGNLDTAAFKMPGCKKRKCRALSKRKQ